MIIKNAKIFNGLDFIDEKIIRIKGKTIAGFGNDTANDNVVIDAGNDYVLPGLIDIHTHGIMGYDLNECSENELDSAVRAYLENGTTSLLPTTVSQDMSKTLRLLEYVKKPSCPTGIIGVHLEAPYISSKKLGAQNGEFIEVPDVGKFLERFSSFLPLIRRVTIAPELDNDFRLGEKLSSAGVLVSFGHTTCDAKTGEKAFAHGYTLATHFMNAMPSVFHREVGITGKALINDNVSIEIIADLMHICPDMIEICLRLKSDDRVVIVSDSMSAAHLKDGEYVLGGMNVIVKDRTAKLQSGNLAGSLITMLDGVRNFVNIGVPEEKAFRFATYNPAKLLGMQDRIGMLKTGNDADILILDKKLNIKKVISKGNLI